MNPYRISTHDLGRRPGSTDTLALDVPAQHAMGNEVIAVPAGATISLDLRMEAVMDGVLITGSASAHARGECVRCLDDVEQDVVVDVTEMFAYPGTQDEAELGEDEDPLPELDDEVADIESTVVDAVVLSLPFQPLCRPDCPGLCSVCGIRLADAEPGHAHEQIDPRWAALEQLRSQGEQARREDDRDEDGPGE